MRISNLKIAARGVIKKCIKNIILYGLVGTLLGAPVYSSAEAKAKTRLQAKNVQTTEWDMEQNDFPMGVVLYTGDYMEKSYVNYMKPGIKDEVGPDDLIVVHETECIKMEEEHFYFKTRYRIWFHDIKISDFEDMETIARVDRALNNLFNGLEVNENIEIISEEDIVIKSIEPLEANDACSKRWIENINTMEDEEEHDVPVEEPTAKQDMMVKGGFASAAGIGIVILLRDLMKGRDSNTKNVKRYFKRRKKQSNFTQKMSKS